MAIITRIIITRSTADRDTTAVQTLVAHGTTADQASVARGIIADQVLAAHGTTMDRTSVCPGVITDQALASDRGEMVAAGAGNTGQTQYTLKKIITVQGLHHTKSSPSFLA
jgi:hypothetical protein